ncbi:FAD-binding oxidoreductase [Halobacillus shinanisalinarum]|uniref:FAD-binding oxidoreductase n=1 Tax=Halobacillus shinanisalinarum TaxID=2932258 RepID=A0ABY4GTW8_9BACI|nr:FAD-dependent oxidoreductase [Halobacillus shinanisalinarum]UOQ91598.1 FAD-binding oxidoreductase [Halobacillus shinanisalinarum]
MKSYIVIGSGVLGASTAYHLAKAGADVTVVDRQDVGQATDAAAGIICPWLTKRKNKAWYRLAKEGAKYYPALVAELEADGEKETGYKRVGALRLHTDEEKLDEMLERALERSKDAPEMGEITRLSPAETQAMFPPLAEEYGAVHMSGAARVDGRALRDALLRAAKRKGAVFVKGDASLLVEGGQVKGVKTEADTLYADRVIVAAGAWAKELVQPLGVNLLVHPQKAQIVHLELPETNTNDWPVVMPPTNKYLLSFDGGKVVVGATHETKEKFDSRVTAGGLHEIFNKVLAIAPGLDRSTMLETRVGFRPFTPDSLPVFGAVPNFGGLFLANGLGASGLTTGPYIGAELARIALDKPTELDADDYKIEFAIASEKK